MYDGIVMKGNTHHTNLKAITNIRKDISVNTAINIEVNKPRR